MHNMEPRPEALLHVTLLHQQGLAAVFQRRYGCTDSGIDVFRWWSHLRHFPRSLENTPSISSIPQGTGWKYPIWSSHSCYWSAICFPEDRKSSLFTRKKKKTNPEESWGKPLSSAHSLLYAFCWRHTDWVVGPNQQLKNTYFNHLYIQRYSGTVLLGGWMEKA